MTSKEPERTIQINIGKVALRVATLGGWFVLLSGVGLGIWDAVDVSKINVETDQGTVSTNLGDAFKAFWTTLAQIGGLGVLIIVVSEVLQGIRAKTG